jgi:hypothetical protein
MPPISALQKEGFLGSDTFKNQVFTIVTKETVYKSETIADLDQPSLDQLARVIRSVNTYGFEVTCVNDVNWDVTFDVWAADPPAQDNKISGLVNQHYALLTGFNPPVPAPP